MKRHNHLFEEITGYENIRLAFLKAMRGKRLGKEELLYRQNLERNLECLGDKLKAGTKTFGPYRSFVITDPKERVISAAPLEDRIAHHAIMNAAEFLFERQLVFHSYACRKNKGTHAAVKYAFSKCKGHPWFLKLDVRKYFDSIDHEVLKNQLARLIKDKQLLALFGRIIDSYETSAAKGVPIGNLTSQYFANLYLSGLDHFILERLRPAAYVRYMDDFILWGKSRSELHCMLQEIQNYSRGQLRLVLKPAVLGKTAHGLPFLGFLIKPSGIFLMQKSKRRIKDRIAEIKQGLARRTLNETEAGEKVVSVYAAAALARSRSFRVSLWYGNCRANLAE